MSLQEHTDDRLLPHLLPSGSGISGPLRTVRQPAAHDAGAEASQILTEFAKLLAHPVADGQRKRAAGSKPNWKIDRGHAAALQRHLDRWDRGELIDAESGAHPLTHAAFRCLAIAWQETHRDEWDC